MSDAIDINDVLEDMRKQKDGAYEERNRVVALLARLLPSGIKRTAIEGWDPAWHNCVYIELPAMCGQQASWHYHDDDAHLFNGLPEFTGEWDGHTTEEKYKRIEHCCWLNDSSRNGEWWTAQS